MKTVLFLTCLTFILFSEACKKSDWRDDPNNLVGSYRILVYCDSSGVPCPAPFVDTMYVQYNSSVPALVINGELVNKTSENSGSISYQYSHNSGQASYTFWDGSDSIGYNETVAPIVSPNHCSGHGVKIH